MTKSSVAFVFINVSSESLTASRKLSISDADTESRNCMSSNDLP
ncbi:unnamed protein product, partial [Rotaria sp. Silwood1]